MPKLPEDLLKIFFTSTYEDPSVVKGPEYGEDAAVIDLGERYLVVHPDPISGADF